jgi:signal transduction histidine kinase
MTEPKIPENEIDRIHRLYNLNILDSPEDPDLQEIVNLSAQICGTPVSLISLIDSDRQWFKAKKGINEKQTERKFSVCAHAINQDDLFLVKDLSKDKRFENLPAVKEDGTKFYAGNPLKTSDGYNIGMLCVIDYKPRELTETQKKAIETLSRLVIQLIENKQKQELHQANTSILIEQVNRLEERNFLYKRMMSIISHDLFSPLNTINQTLELFQNDLLSHEEIKEIFSNLSNQVKNTEGLLKNLVEWGISLQQQPQLKLAETIDINLFDIIESNKSLVKTRLELKNLTFENLVPENFMVNSNLQMLTYIIRNLIQNSVKFTENGVIYVSVEPKQNALEIIVKDTGIGISKENLSRLNHKEESALSEIGTKSEKGFGLGLMVAKEFVEKLNAQLIFKSEIGKGTSVHLVLSHF